MSAWRSSVDGTSRRRPAEVLGDADAGPQRHLRAGDARGAGQAAREALGEVDAPALRHDRELVAAEPGHQVVLAHRGDEPRATSTSSASPASCPRESFTCLNSSRSSSATHVRRPEAPSAASRSCSADRLARPVRPSVVARRRSSCSPARSRGSPPRLAHQPGAAQRRQHEHQRGGDGEGEHVDLVAASRCCAASMPGASSAATPSPNHAGGSAALRRLHRLGEGHHPGCSAIAPITK